MAMKMMMIFSHNNVGRLVLGVLLVIASFSSSSSASTESSESLSMRPNQEYGQLFPMLGKNDLSELSFTYDLNIDAETCEYELIFNYKVNPKFPVGDGTTCRPSEIADYDGNSMLEGRWFYEEFPPYVEDAINVNHVSIDYNPCGHPGPGWLIPHLDMHVYRVSPNYRVHDMNCEVIAGTPACWQDQYIEEGQKFFNLNFASDGINLKNIPEGYYFAPEDVVIHMGSHILETPPSTPEDWIDPSYILGTYDGNVIFFEPMLPTHYIMGNEDQYYERTLLYVEKDDMSLPDYFSIEYDSNTRFITTIFKGGKSNICKTEFDILKQEYESMISNQNNSGAGSSIPRQIISFLLLLVTSTAATLLM